MTVQELIEKLEKIEDKSLPVRCYETDYEWLVEYQQDLSNIKSIEEEVVLYFSTINCFDMDMGEYHD